MQLTQCESTLRSRNSFAYAEQHQLFHTINEDHLGNDLYLYSVCFRDAFYAACYNKYGHTDCLEKVSISLEAIADRIWRASGFGKEYRVRFHSSDLLTSMMEILVNSDDVEVIILDGNFKYILGNVDKRKRTKEQRQGLKLFKEFDESGCEDLPEFFRMLAEKSFAMSTVDRNVC